jgi:hypothetical protein
MDPAFWDTSALVPLCVVEPASSRVDALSKSFSMVVWWGTPLEIASSFARLKRMKQIDALELAAAKRDALQLSRSWAVIAPSDPVRDQAIGLLSQHALRAGDALQLSAALEWCHRRPHGRVFLTADQRLRQAATLCGFDAKTV